MLVISKIKKKLLNNELILEDISVNLSYKTKGKLELEKFITEWSNKFPWDNWWRKKYKIPFLSEQHKKISHFEMLLEYVEGKYLEKRRQEEENEQESKENKTLGLGGDKKEVKMSKKELDDVFENINIDEFN